MAKKQKTDMTSIYVIDAFDQRNWKHFTPDPGAFLSAKKADAYCKMHSVRGVVMTWKKVTLANTTKIYTDKGQKTVKKDWVIMSHDDYHEIKDYELSKAVELGCFPEDGCAYHRYFGLYYQGKRPSFDEVWPVISEKLILDDEKMSEQEIRKQLRRVLR